MFRGRNILYLKDVLVISVTAFGGPQVHIAMMLNLMVRKRHYLTEEELMEKSENLMMKLGISALVEQARQEAEPEEFSGIFAMYLLSMAHALKEDIPQIMANIKPCGKPNCQCHKTALSVMEAVRIMSQIPNP